MGTFPQASMWGVSGQGTHCPRRLPESQPLCLHAVGTCFQGHLKYTHLGFSKDLIYLSTDGSIPNGS